MKLLNWKETNRPEWFLPPRRPIGLAALLLCAAGGLSALQVAVVEQVVPTANSFPQGIVLGPDHALWVTEYGANKIARFTPDGKFTEYPVPTAGSAPNGIVVGPDGALWFTEYFTNKIGRITVGGAITEFDLPGANSFPARITNGPDGALWFTEFNSHKIGRISTAGAIVEYSLADGSYPIDIAAGPDGALWFTESSGNRIGRITTAGVITEYGLPAADSFPSAITAGPDGALWFTEQSANKIGRITVSGAITEYPSAGGPIAITTGPDGALWFTENFGVKVGRITTAGAITEFPVPTPGYLQGIAAGPGGALYFAENSANRIGQLFGQTAVLTAAPSQSVPGGSVTLTGSGFAAGESVSILDDIGPFRMAVADGSGAVVASGPVRQAPYGNNSFVGVGQSSRKRAVARLFVTPRLLAVPSTVTAGSVVTVSGYGLNAHDSLGVYVDSFTLAGSSISDSHGTMAGPNAVKFTVPARLPPGNHVISALGSNGVTAQASITVQ